MADKQSRGRGGRRGGRVRGQPRRGGVDGGGGEEEPKPHRSSTSVEDFTVEFDRLRMRCDVDEEEEQTVARRFTGTENGKRVVGPNPVRNSSTGVTPNTSSSREGMTNSKRCYKCQGLGHFAADCPNRQIVTFLEEDLGPVFDDNREVVEENHSDHEEITYADYGEMLVVRRALSSGLVGRL
ncbi:reverse transcriptase domain-containing protein [Tanacetum coccineum]